MTDIIEYSLQIADVFFRIDIDHELKKSNSFLDFLINRSTISNLSDVEWTFQFGGDTNLSIPLGILMFKTGEYTFYMSHDNKYVCVFHDMKSQGHVYAVSVIDEDNKSTQITYLPSAKEYFSEFSNCFFHTCWEKAMSLNGRFILHSACVKTKLGGILFSGPSGIGKSTQADLWVRYENAELLNGDRTIIYADPNGKWTASGSPYAGSSKCYKNKQCEVKAIVMLKQSENCSIRRLNLAESFHRIYQQCTIYSWDEAFVSTICDLVMDVCVQVPVYEYSCNISEEAVQILKEELEER